MVGSSLDTHPKKTPEKNPTTNTEKQLGYRKEIGRLFS